MNFIDRVKLAGSILTGRQPKQPARQVKQAPILWPEWRNGKVEWQQTDISSYIREGFGANSVIYAAMAYKFRTITSSPLRAYKGDPGSPELLPANNPLSKLIARPNQYQDEATFKMLNFCYLDLAGECFIFQDRGGRKSGLPEKLYTLRPDWVTILASKEKKNELMGYYYRPEGWPINEGLPILPSDMIHVKLPNPGDELGGFGHGLSPMAALARSADVDNSITRFLKMFFDSGTAMNTVVTFDIPMDDNQIRAVKERWSEIYGGVDNWGEVGVLGNGGKVARLGYSFDEMGFAEQDERNESRMLGPLGVSPILTGTRLGMKNSTMANYEQARDACNQQTILPTLRLFENGYNTMLPPGSNEFLRYDISELPGMQKNIAQLVTAAKDLWAMGYPADVATSFVGLNIGTSPVSNQSFLPTGVAPAGSTPQASAENPTGGKGVDWADGRWGRMLDFAIKQEAFFDGANVMLWGEEQKTAHWNSTNELAQKYEREIQPPASAEFQREMRETLAALGAAKALALESKATPDWESFWKSVQEIIKRGGERWFDLLTPITGEAIKAQAKYLSGAFNLEFSAIDFRDTWFNELVLKLGTKAVTQISDTTKKDIAKLLGKARSEGWGIDDMAKELRQYFTTAEGYRAENIARTESIRALNAGSSELYYQWGVEEQEWISTRDKRTRNGVNSPYNHLAADGEIVKVGQPFTKTGAPLMYPGDVDGDAGNVIQCRCTTAPVVNE